MHLRVRDVVGALCLAGVLVGLVILFVSGAALWSRKWAARRRITEAIDGEAIEGNGIGGDEETLR